MIFLECNADKALVCALGIPRKEIRHMYSKGNVCNALKKSTNSKGLVDEDPGRTQPTYIGTLRAPIFDQHQIRVLRDKKFQNDLIVLCPTLEHWILKVATQARIDISKYNLPKDQPTLHKLINIKLVHVKKLIIDIKQKSKMLKTSERYLKGD